MTPKQVVEHYAALPLSFFENVYDEYTGQRLDPAMVREGQLHELREWDNFNVYEDRPDHQLRRHKKVGMRWVDHMKLTDDGWVVRSRLVLQEFALGIERDGVHQGTNPVLAIRIVLSRWPPPGAP